MSTPDRDRIRRVRTPAESADRKKKKTEAMFMKRTLARVGAAAGLNRKNLPRLQSEYKRRQIG